MNVLERISQELGIESWKIEKAVELLDQGSTVPFIARYRKEVTGSLTDTELRTITERLSYLRNLEERKKTVLEQIESLGKLTDDLKEKIMQTFPHTEDEVKNKFMLESMIEMKTILSDDAKIAKMLTEGSNQAIMTMTHLLNKEENVDPKIKAFADDFEDISKRYIEELKEFL